MSLSESSSPLILTSPREAEIYQVLGDWILSSLGNDFTVLQGQQNRAPPPLGGFVTMVISNKERLCTNTRKYQEDETVLITSSFMFTLQVSCIGKGAGEAISLIKMLWRDLSCCTFFQQNLPSCAPVDSDKPRQSPLITPEKQYEDKWDLELRLNVLIKTSIKQETMKEANLKIISI